MPATKVAKKQLCEDHNCQQWTMASRPLVKPASAKGLYISCSPIRGFGHPVGRHGRGEGKGQQRKSAKQSVNRTPVRGRVWSLFLGADPIPLRRRVEVDSVQPHPPFCKVTRYRPHQKACCPRTTFRIIRDSSVTNNTQYLRHRELCTKKFWN